LVTTNALAMLNTADKMATPIAQEAFEKFRETVGRPCHMQFVGHWARLIETVEALEVINNLLKDPDIVSDDIMVSDVEPVEAEGVGMVEAPRGILIYNLWTDEKGIIKKLNQLFSTNNNFWGVEIILKATANAIYEDKVLEKIKLPEPLAK
ncbi:MAG: Ni/Fe hydrogenase subunit alpha, partial [Promethearchaeota archaeon]